MVLGESGPMVEAWTSAGAAVDVIRVSETRTAATVADYAREYLPAGVICWHGLPRLPQILYGLRGAGVPTVVHAGNPATSMPRWVDWKFLLLGALYPASRLPTYVCCSRYVSDSLAASRYLRRFPRAVVPNGVNVAGPEGRRRPRPGSDERFTVGMVARLDAIKDHRTLLAAFALLRKRVPHARLSLAGDGPAGHALREFARELGVLSSVDFLGTVADVTAAMAEWDVFAYATTEREGFGNSLAEAMMFGLPCVATDIGPIGELCGDAAILASPRNPAALAEALERLVSDPVLRSHVALSGRERAVREFHPEVFAQRYADILFGTGSRPCGRPSFGVLLR
jgi:glycosyltransferase involved in cell wall biosynthesis